MAAEPEPQQKVNPGVRSSGEGPKARRTRICAVREAKEVVCEMIRSAEARSARVREQVDAQNRKPAAVMYSGAVTARCLRCGAEGAREKYERGCFRQA